MLCEYHNGKEIPVDDKTQVFSSVEQEIVSKRQNRFTFDAVGIEKGAELVFKSDDNIKCNVEGFYSNTNKVLYEGETYSISGLTGIILRDKFGWIAVGDPQGTKFWKYKGEILTDRRKRLEGQSKSVQED